MRKRDNNVAPVDLAIVMALACTTDATTVRLNDALYDKLGLLKEMEKTTKLK